MMTTKPFLRILAFQALYCSRSTWSVSATMVLRQLHVVTRQGSSTTVIDGEQNAPIQTLSPVGQTQLYNLGAWIRKAFHEDPPDDDLNVLELPEGLVDEYYPTRIRLESSALDSTIVSAQSLAQGLFPTSMRGIPVFTQAERNDITIAAEFQCPAFSHDIDLPFLSESQEWKQMEQAYMKLLRELALVPILSGYSTVSSTDSPFQYIPLYNVPYVYDLIREARITCNEGYDTTNIELCEKLPFPDAAALLGDMEWEDLKTLARYSEVETKYGTAKAGQFLAGNLLRQIADRMIDDQMSMPEDHTTKRVFVTSTDYPTLIALMSALQVEPDDEQLKEAFPGYGSAVLFELYQDTKSYQHAVRVTYKAAGELRAATLRMGDECFEKEICDMGSFMSLVESSILQTKDWCQACGNDTSDVCLFYSRLDYQERLRDEEAAEEFILQNITASYNPAETLREFTGRNACPDSKSIRHSFEAVFLGGMTLGIFMTCIVFTIFLCLRKQRQSRNRRITADVVGKGELTLPKTPETTASSSSPLPVLQPKWTDSPSSSANEDVDVDRLSLDGENEDHSNEFVPLSPKRTPTAPAAKMPSKHVFPPEII